VRIRTWKTGLLQNVTSGTEDECGEGHCSSAISPAAEKDIDGMLQRMRMRFTNDKLSEFSEIYPFDKFSDTKLECSAIVIMKTRDQWILSTNFIVSLPLLVRS
jgi:hypothetical protein